MLRAIKPKNARSKRALDAREPKEVEDARTAIFVKGTHTGETLNAVMKDLMSLKRPHGISFNKKNTIHPFDAASNSAASLEFWAQKNDASMFLVGQSTKKRPNALTFVRMFDEKVLDMVEVGVDEYKGMAEFKTPKSTPGHKPLLHFASELFDTHPRFIQLKSMFIDFFNGEEIDSISLTGLEHIISISLAPTPTALNHASFASTFPTPLTSGANADIISGFGTTTANTTNAPTILPKIHLRTYTTKLLSSGSRTPLVSLTPMGPALTFKLLRSSPPDADLMKEAMRRPKLKKKEVEKGLGKKKKNLEVDEMGDLRGRVHVGKQDLGGVRGRRVKGLRKGEGEGGEVSEGWEEEGGAGTAEEGRGRKRRKVQQQEEDVAMEE